MGGTRDRIVVKGASGVNTLDFKSFKASKAQCYLKRDRERLLAVIEAGFGTLGAFDKQIREVLEERAKAEA